jgi:hypothetical protein
LEQLVDDDVDDDNDMLRIQMNCVKEEASSHHSFTIKVAKKGGKIKRQKGGPTIRHFSPKCALSIIIFTLYW